MDIGFELRGIPGRVTVTYAVNDRPELVGTRADAAGFPMCHASVDYPARGYDAVLGWVQLVRSNDNASGGRDYEIDPLAFLGDVPHPFCWIGLEPQLFDSPSRDPRPDMDWSAQSFLCVPEDGADARLAVRALVGFSWGFRIRAGQIELVPPRRLSAEDWDGHVGMLAIRYPAWRFVPGFRDESAPYITRS